MKKKKTPSNYDLTPAQLIEKGSRVTEILVLSVLADKFAFGDDQMQRFYETLTKFAEEVRDKRICIKDLVKVLKDEYNIIFEGY